MLLFIARQMYFSAWTLILVLHFFFFFSISLSSNVVLENFGINRNMLLFISTCTYRSTLVLELWFLFFSIILSLNVVLGNFDINRNLLQMKVYVYRAFENCTETLFFLLTRYNQSFYWLQFLLLKKYILVKNYT